MGKIGLMDKGSDQLDARSSVAGTDRIPVFTSTSTEAKLATVDQIAASASGLLDNNNTWTGTNGFDGAVSVGKSGTAGVISVYPSTDLKGKLAVTVQDQTGDTTVTLDFDEHGQTTTVNLPDAGSATTNLVQSTAALTLAEADILDGATVTTLELNRLDDSAEVESVTAAGAASVTKFNTNLNVASGGAVTLAACPATMIGKIKTIRMATDDGDVTIALTNVQGGTAATTATFDDIGEELILVGSAGGKWTVVKEFGVTLS